MTDTVTQKIRSDPMSLSEPEMDVVSVDVERRNDPDRTYLFVAVTVKVPPGKDTWPVDSGLALRRAVRDRARRIGWDDDVVVVFIADPATVSQEDLPDDPPLPTDEP